MDPEVKEIEALVNAVRPLFAGKSASVQGAALADLLAMWLAGHVAPGDAEATALARAELLKLHLETVTGLVPINFAALVEPRL